MATPVDEWKKKSFLLGGVFTPRTPINARKLFSGRIPQINKVLDAVSQKGSHAMLYGERGVGKTSLSNVLSDYLTGVAAFVLPRVNCDASDTYSSVWKKILQDFEITRRKSGVGFNAAERLEVTSIVESMPDVVTPDHIRRTISDLSQKSAIVFIFDEYDRLQDRKSRMMMADTIKMLSDYSVSATILLIGVADTVDQLIEDHLSIERALVQIPMPRMSDIEINDIVENGLSQIKMKIEAGPLKTIVNLSQGLPYVTHLLSLHAAKSALSQKSLTILDGHVQVGINKSLEEWQQSIKSAYYEATKSQQPDTIYKQVLLACALAEKDEFGYFSAAAVRTPLSSNTGKYYDIPNFARHLKEFSEIGRGQILEKAGGKRKIRYRFTSPLIQPYIIIRASKEGDLRTH
ncbi:MAG: AAA family ATPase [Aestuariivirga sp.]|nr:AAA family ATPase [Aestuariivirga sp.]